MSVQTTVSIVDEMKQELQRVPINVRTVPLPGSPAPESSIRKWARENLGFDSEERIQGLKVAAHNSTQEKFDVESIAQLALGNADIVPFDPASVVRYMSGIEERTVKRNVKEYDARKSSVIPSPVAESLLSNRLFVHPDYAALKWFACEIGDYLDDIPDFVLRKLKQVSESFAALGSPDVALSFQVVFTAASVYLAPNESSNLASAVIKRQFRLGDELLPIHHPGANRPYLSRDHAMDAKSIIDEAQRFEASVPFNGSNDGSRAYSNLALLHRLSPATDAAIQAALELPQCEPFLIATFTKGAHVVRHAIEVWDEREFENQL